ncbi:MULTISPECIES: M57 family metalloprotease [Tenacibaculum]|uniref:M57 family metalloprotease n=1 Tax=Tenacibaculum TaxID=104267 RepID=UPI00089B4B9A|nr:MULTISPECIES: M57 family metalloprotease [unclassified Tenacibaculum]RBW62985.1 peptidase [Tenacibaculum sp. E3R01]SEE65956.1 Dual-action HEIGH metallo-peptidase [Tenacibaculum sp. MAR_2010_89]
MKRIYLKTAGVLLALATLNSCNNDGNVNDPNLTEDDEISIEVINKLKEVNLNVDYIKTVTFKSLDGKTEKLYEVEGDVTISHEELMKIGTQQSKSSTSSKRQYRTYNLVSSPSTIKVVGYTGGVNALSSTARTGLQYAVNNFNNLNSSINMQLVFSTQFSSSDIVVYRTTDTNDVPADGIRGRANFPQNNGLPGHWVRINQGANNSNDTQIIEGLMTHEIGHAIGLRHTDWNTRQSCRQSGESAGSAGAVYIPGTAGASNDSNSIMNACFPSHVQGELSNYDKIALEYIY